MIALPAVGAAVVALLPKGRELVIKQVALGISLLVLLLAVLATVAFDPHGPRFQLVTSVSWIASFGVRFALGVDGIALVMVLLVGVLVPVVIGASWTEDSWNETDAGGRSGRAFFAWLLLLEAMMVGVFAATDVFLYSLVGGLIMLAAVIGLYVVSSSQFGAGTFAFDALRHLHITPGTQKLLFLGFFVAFAIKAPLVPFHTWLPDAGAEAPVGGAVLLVGVLDKVGTFGFLRYCLPLFPDASRAFAPWILVLAVVGILYAALLAMGQSDMKRLISYTSISHFGFIALGIFAFTTEAGTGAVLYMVNHGLATGLLFLVVGMLIGCGKSRQIGDYGGVAAKAPLLGGAFLVAGLASLALPATNSFVSEFLVLIGSFHPRPVFTILATVGMILAALYILLMYQRTMQGPPRGVLLADADADAAADDEPAPHGGGATTTLAAPRRVLKVLDLDRRELAIVTPLIALIIALGVYPQPMLRLIEPAVHATLSDMGGAG